MFLCNSTLSILCSPDEGPTEERLQRSQWDLGRIEWPGEDEGINYHLAHGDWIRIKIEKHLGLVVAIGAAVLVLGFVVAIKLI